MIVDGAGSILDGDSEAIVDPVNCIGVSGAGLALAIKKRYPTEEREFIEWCHRGQAEVGKVLPVEVAGSAGAARLIYYFPTKVHWRNGSDIQYVRMGLEALAEDVNRRSLSSISVPALGCGLGGLRYADVRPLIERFAGLVSATRVVAYPDTSRRNGR